MRGKLDGKVALVIGGTADDGRHSIGAAMCHFLRDEGAFVLPASRNPSKVAATLDALKNDKSIDAAPLAFDATDDDGLRRCLDCVESSYGPIDVLVNSQGINRKKPTVEYTRDDWEAIIGVNLTSLGIACQLVGARMIERRRGHIINIASETALLAFPYVAPYGASKGGVRALTAHLAAEWGRFGVCINAIAPGLFLTALNRPIMKKDPVRLQKILDATPAGRLGDEEFEDLRAAAIFLATCSPYVNGQLIAVDGGMSIAAFTP